MKLYRASESQYVSKPGYSANYVANIEFNQSIDNAGVILVKIPEGKTKPHVHNILEELFVAVSSLKLIVDGDEYQLDEGDTVLVEPGESHSFESPYGKTSFIIAIKFPNLTADKG